MPGTRCGIYGCNNTYKTNTNGVKYNFHRMPKAKDLVSDTIRKQWIIRCKRKDTFNADNIFICSAHFTKNDFERDFQNELQFPVSGLFGFSRVLFENRRDYAQYNV
ncbi:hypothetical protein NQ315_016091 [Exocentrus adspersus]|uniref:THAP-type domain-containing protein n=1 Tax=Exocentrus adspersus TaxID=1586481 RepID=A0AAV8VL34_9CUCU|nr:hypothetical protein NQ315_016091 [Exocentrus adspersus]